MCLTRPSYDIIKHFKIQLKYLLKLNERLVELFFYHSDIMSEQMYIEEMNISKGLQENWNKVKDVLDIYKHRPYDSRMFDPVGLDYLEEDIALAEMTQLNIINEVKRKKKKQLK